MTTGTVTLNGTIPQTDALSTVGLDPAIASLDFTKIRWKLTLKNEGAGWSDATCRRLETEYKRFLTLIKFHPDTPIVPTKEIDEFWHAHILDTRKYRTDCEIAFGRFVDHYPYFGIHDEMDQRRLKEAFANTRRLYESRFGVQGSYVENPARCEGHACHVESECACRTPGACKDE